MLLVAGCGGGASPSPSAQAYAPAIVPAKVLIAIALAAPPANAGRSAPAYVSSATKSATVTVTNAGTTLAPVTINCTTNACSGTVVAPYGADTFTVNLYDGVNGSGDLLSTGSVMQTIVANATNAVNLTTNGVVHAFSLAVGSASAGSATSVPITVNATDASGATIIAPGGYASQSGSALTITLTDSDTSGATSLAQSTVTGPGGLSMTYSGLAFTSPVSITASAQGYPSATATFAPTLQPIVIATNDTLNPSFAGIDLYATSGAGSSGSLSASEVGWTNFGKSFSLSVPSACSTITTLASGTGTTFTANVASSPVAGECTATLADGVGQSTQLTFAYTQFAYTGSSQTIVVPAGVTQAQIDATGGNGGSANNGGGTSPGGLGATINAVVPVSAGTLTIGVAGASGNGGFTVPFAPQTEAGGLGGYNGGGAGGAATLTATGGGLPLASGGGGGGATTAAQGPTVLLVAGGGGGAGPNCPSGSDGNGGDAGWPSGSSNVVYYPTCLADDSGTPIGFPGYGGSATAGGAGGASDGVAGDTAGIAGSSLTGGAGGTSTSSFGGDWAGGGGGAGWYGGGGGGGALTIAAPGGGGSSYCGGCTPISTGNAPVTSGAYNGNGSVTLIF